MITRQRALWGLSVGGIALAAAAVLCLFTVEERETAIVTRFGKVDREVTEPGLHARWPEPVESVIRYRTRLRVYESVPLEMLTADKKNLLVNAYVLWRIGAPLKFLTTVRDEPTATTRLDDSLRAALRSEVGLASLAEVIGGRRDAISGAVLERVRLEAQLIGVEIADVRIKRVFFPKQNLASVFQRMTAERQKIAAGYRSQGREEAMKLMAQAEREQAAILAESQREAEILRGEGEAEALRLMTAEAALDPALYDFVRALDAYPKVLGEQSTLVLSMDSALFKHLRPADGPRAR